MAELAVIGMGQFGRAVARSLVREGQAVLAVDLDAERLRRIEHEVDATARTDTTDEDQVAALKLDRMSCVVVAIGIRGAEAALLTVAILKELGVPRIVARCFDRRHGRLLLAIGAHEVLNPEEESGERLASRLARPGILDQMEFGDVRLAEVEAPEGFVGATLAELDLRGEHGVTVMAIQREGRVFANPGPDETLESGDVLVLLGEDGAIREVAALR